MIDALYIKNFKSIRSVNLELSGMNLLFGMNGMGKSSTIQSLLLCRQSFWKNGETNLDKLYPNGALVNLGSTSEVFNKKAEDDLLEIIIEENGVEQNLSYLYRSDISDYGVVFNKTDESNFNDFTGCLFSDGFVYLTAEHIGPRRKYEYSSWETSGINKFGTKGEYTIPFLATNGTKITVPKEVCHPQALSDKLIDQCSAWMSCISPGVRLNAEMSPQDQEARLRISYNEKGIVSDDYSPVNVGFGIPYVLPVIVALLSAKKGDLVIIENPESHLHPRGQAYLSELMSHAVASGVQIICESHSDHVINGVRVAVKEHVINKENVAIFYYNKNENQDTVCSSINIDAAGNLDSYPDGLLDEWGELMSRLI